MRQCEGPVARFILSSLPICPAVTDKRKKDRRQTARRIIVSKPANDHEPPTFPRTYTDSGTSRNANPSERSCVRGPPMPRTRIRSQRTLFRRGETALFRVAYRAQGRGLAPSRYSFYLFAQSQIATIRASTNSGHPAFIAPRYTLLSCAINTRRYSHGTSCFAIILQSRRSPNTDTIMVYTTEHIIFLQTLMHRGLLDENKAKDIVIKLFNNDKVSVIVNQINEQLQPLNMLIKKAQCEITGQAYWVFVSTVLDDVTRFQEEFTKGQLALLRNIFSEIITSSNGCAQSIHCLNLCSLPDVKLTKTDAEEFLSDVVRRQWLAYKDGYYYMGVRSITELMPYFRATYENNLCTCCLCKQVIFHGEKCLHCQSLLHLYCLKKFAMVTNPVECPTCHAPFHDFDLSGLIDDPAASTYEETKVKRR